MAQNRHNISRADKLYHGKADLPGYNANIPGIELSHLVSFRPTGARAITLGSTPAAGDLGNTLAAGNFAGPTGYYPLTLSSGQMVQALFTNGSNAITYWNAFPLHGAATPAMLTSPATTAAIGTGFPPVAASSTAFAASQAVAIAPAMAVFNGPAPYVTTYNGVAAAQPDVPRNVVAAWTGAAVITVTGYDSAGQLMTESAASGTALTGNKAFAYVTSVTFSAAVTAFTMGFGSKIGIPFKVISGTVAAVTVADAVDAGTLVLRDITIPATSLTGDPKGTYTPATAMDGTKFLSMLLCVVDAATQMGAWGTPQA
jgi:hypothetical protein